MDTDGIAAEIIFHNSFNGEPMPFADFGWPDPANPELARVGFQIYSRWERGEGEHVVAGICEDGGGVGEALGEHGDNLVELFET